MKPSGRSGQRCPVPLPFPRVSVVQPWPGPVATPRVAAPCSTGGARPVSGNPGPRNTAHLSGRTSGSAPTWSFWFAHQASLSLRRRSMQSGHRSAPLNVVYGLLQSGHSTRPLCGRSPGSQVGLAPSLCWGASSPALAGSLPGVQDAHLAYKVPAHSHRSGRNTRWRPSTPLRWNERS